MLVDNDRAIRQKAVDVIVNSRRVQLNTIRTFGKPHINFDASNYTEMIEFDNDDGIEPPITKSLSIDDLNQCVDSPKNVSRYTMPYSICRESDSVSKFKITKYIH